MKLKQMFAPPVTSRAVATNNYINENAAVFTHILFTALYLFVKFLRIKKSYKTKNRKELEERFRNDGSLMQVPIKMAMHNNDNMERWCNANTEGKRKLCRIKQSK